LLYKHKYLKYINIHKYIYTNKKIKKENIILKIKRKSIRVKSEQTTKNAQATWSR